MMQISICGLYVHTCMDASHGTNIFDGELALSTANVTADIIADAALATSASGAANTPNFARAQAARTGQATEIGTQTEKLAQVMPAGLSPSRGRKRQIADSSWKSEVRCTCQYICWTLTVQRSCKHI